MQKKSGYSDYDFFFLKKFEYANDALMKYYKYFKK